MRRGWGAGPGPPSCHGVEHSRVNTGSQAPGLGPHPSPEMLRAVAGPPRRVSMRERSGWLRACKFGKLNKWSVCVKGKTDLSHVVRTTSFLEQVALLFFSFVIYFLNIIDVWEKYRLVASHLPQPGTWPACNPGMCPDWESNRQPLGPQASTQSTEPHQPGLEQMTLLIKFRRLAAHDVAEFQGLTCGRANKR